MDKTLNRLSAFILLSLALSFIGSYYFAPHVLSDINRFTQAKVILDTGKITLNLYIMIAAYLIVALLINVFVPYVFHQLFKKNPAYKKVYAIIPFAGFCAGCALGYIQSKTVLLYLTETIKTDASIQFDAVVSIMLKLMLVEGSLIMGICSFTAIFFFVQRYVKALSLAITVLLLGVFLVVQVLLALP